MAKPLRLFIRPPYIDDGTPAAWTRVHSYGPEPAPSTTVHTHTLLRTTGDGVLLAAADGKLSVLPPGAAALPPNEEVVAPDDTEPLPPTVTLYLHLSPTVAQEAAFRARAQEAGGLDGFAYLNVETDSLLTQLDDLLDVDSPPPGLVRVEMVSLMVRGVLDIPVTAGHAIGQASTHGAPAGSRQAGFTALSQRSPVDPSFVYDHMRAFLEDAQPVLDAFLVLAPKRWPAIDPGLTTDQAIQATTRAVFSMAVLDELKRSRSLTYAQWRQVGDNQKALYRQMLLARTGHAPAGSTAPHFEFNDLDWANLFQLEAITEFYAHFDDPWAAGAVPLEPTLPGPPPTPNPNFVPVDFLDPEGTAATAAGNVITLDGTADLNRVRANKDLLFLETDTARPNRHYKITSVNVANRTVRLQGTPTLTGGTSAWRISLRPVVVGIDALGGRLSGSAATVAAAPATETVSLDGTPNLRRVNPNFDTIYFPSDQARPKRTYRIIARDYTNHTVTLDGQPDFGGGTSAWHIPAGLSGEPPAMTYNLGPANPPTNAALALRYYDHFDATMFVVHNGAVHGKVRFSTYTSRNYAAGSGSLSSVRGNRRYDISSYRSGGSEFRNFCFKVTDPNAAYDGVREGRYYFTTPVTEDRVAPPANPADPGNGKTEIRIHDAHDTGNGSGSAGCITSPDYFTLRDYLIDRQQVDHEALNGPGTQDAQLAQLNGLGRQATHNAWNNNLAPNWTGKISGTLWVIRPDERPL
ncbi:hypothetical protein F0U60_31350 [Archangium minus]|uniref:YkuD domain-containing protein n=1 Tax=Archangium minus TaxID=83450 RepID=A0ABY9WYD1_9BACT|nr:hypothetical protein F0U60_31350 [Archangium minus]